MAGLAAALRACVTVVLICNVHCNGDIVSVNNRMDGLDDDIIQLKAGLLRVETRVQHQIDSAKTWLRSELRQHITAHVREAIVEIFQDVSIEEMVRSQVITEVRQLKRGNHQMKRQLHNVLISVRDVREGINTYKETIEKAKRDANELNICSKCVVDSQILKRDLDECKNRNNEFNYHMDKTDKELPTLNFNQTNQLPVRERDMSLTAATTQVVTTKSGTTALSSLPTTPKPEEERSRIIIAPVWSSTHQFRQLDIHSNTVTTYQLRSLKRVISLEYVSKLRKLLIGLYSPDKIISSSLDSNDIMTVRQNVETYGMAVDEDREIVFLTTSQPRYTISRMTTHGKDFTAITDLSSYGRYPRAIVVYSKGKKIYACNHGKLFMLTYDGRGLQTIATGSNMYGITVDTIGSIIYYNDDKTLMKMPLSQNVSGIVTTLSVVPWTIAYYKDTIYYSSYADTTIGAVNVRYDTVSYKLQTITGLSYQAICLVP